MTPDQRQAIIAEITKLRDSGKRTDEIVEILHRSGLSFAEAQQLEFEARTKMGPVYRASATAPEDPASVARSLRTYVLLCGLLVIVGVWYSSGSSSAPVPPEQERPAAAGTQSDSAAAIPVPVSAPVPETIWASDKPTQVGRNTYDYHAGSLRYGIVRYECDPGTPPNAAASQYVMSRATEVARTEFINAYNSNRIRIVTQAGEQQPVSLQYICILLSHAQRGGVYCGAVIPAPGFFNSPSTMIDEKRLEYQDLVVETGSAGVKRYPIIERHEEKIIRAQEESRRRISQEEARVIAQPVIADWLRENGYDEQSEKFLRRLETNDPYGYLFTVEGDRTVLKDEGTVTLFIVQVDGKSGKADLQLRTDCAEFLRLLREGGVVPKP